jgi:hypothetical protein
MMKIGSVCGNYGVELRRVVCDSMVEQQIAVPLPQESFKALGMMEIRTTIPEIVAPDHLLA